MGEGVAADILKKAILLERRGRAFYQKVADDTRSDAARRFFSQMAEEEKKHIQVLTEQFNSLQQTGSFKHTELDGHPSTDLSPDVLTEEWKEQVTAADFEAAAISAAMAMEKNAVNLYAQRAEAAADAEEKALYQWLADWEKTHLEQLARIDRELTENIWFDNQFWRF
jgi:rubrerythrin